MAICHGTDPKGEGEWEWQAELNACDLSGELYAPELHIISAAWFASRLVRARWLCCSFKSWPALSTLLQVSMAAISLRHDYHWLQELFIDFICGSTVLSSVQELSLILTVFFWFFFNPCQFYGRTAQSNLAITISCRPFRYAPLHHIIDR